jgi:hypothetical protein
MPGIPSLALLATLAVAQAAPILPKQRPTQDPRPGYYDPPAGRYQLPSGVIVRADPPRGYYDPPAGHYAANAFTGPRSDDILGPLPTPEASMKAWTAKHRRLRIAFGVSLGVVGVGLLAPLVGAGIDRTQPVGIKGVVDGYVSGAIFALVVIPLGLIATTVTGILLGVHKRRRPTANHLLVGPGGIRVAF